MAFPVDLEADVSAYLERLRFSSRTAGTGGLEEAMRYSLLAGGKRVRPVLALATARAIGEQPASVLPLAAAVELIHTYSLIHDDLPAMDDDDLRRGRPTCHVKFGEDVAILAGDALYAEAFSHLLSRQGPIGGAGPDALLSAASELASATGVDGMVGGQYLDVTGQTASGEELRVVHELKTGRLIAASVVCVLLLSGMDAPGVERWRGFADSLGVLFQIVDDVLDVTGTSDQLGKPQGSDARQGKRTYVTEHGIEGARALAAEYHSTARATLSSCVSDENADALAAIADHLISRTS